MEAQQGKKSELTLIELLVVIAIIAVLAAFAVPAITSILARRSMTKEFEALIPYAEFFANLDPGPVSFQAPARMGYEESREARLLLSDIKAISEQQQSLEDKGIVRGQTISVAYNGTVQDHTIKIADVMEAHLSSNNFEITSITPEKQATSGREATEWKWEIRPKNVGELPLHLSLNAVVMLDGQERTRAIQTFDQTVYVEGVGWLGSVGIFVRNEWKWICTVLLIPAIGWLLKHRWKEVRSSHGG